MRPSSPVIAYMGRVLPTLSETFVIREAAALMALGASVELFTLYPPDAAHLHPEMPDAAARAHVVWRPRAAAFWKAHARILREAPDRYRLAVRKFILEPRDRRERRTRSALHFLMAPHAAVLLKRLAVSHVHAHFANVAASVAMMAACLADLPFSFTAHAYDLFVDDLLMEEKLRSARFVATCSRFHVEYLRRHYEAGRDARIEVIHYGIDPSRYSPVGRQAHGRPLVLAVGRLVETKGFHTLIEACGLLRARGMSVRCVIAGDGPEASRLRRLAEVHGVEREVTFTGALQPAEVLEHYERADCLAMPSCVRSNDRDGMPNVLLEAMARGLPVVATRVSGIPELVRDGETGLLVSPDDPEALAAAMGKLLADRDLADRLGRAGRELVRAEFDITRSAGKLLELFSSNTARE